jgi:actin-related protein 6
VQGLVAGNILLTGGNAMLPNIKERFELELRPLVPDHFPVTVFTAPDPINYAWQVGLAV